MKTAKNVVAILAPPSRLIHCLARIIYMEQATFKFPVIEHLKE